MTEQEKDTEREEQAKSNVTDGEAASQAPPPYAP